MRRLKAAWTRMAFACLLAVPMVAAALTLPAEAATTPWQRSDHVAARLFSAVDGTGTLATVPAAIELQLDPHWKTYWRSPGEAGLPPELNWVGSTNLGSAALLYPRPERFTLLGIETFGYTGTVVLPITITPKAPGRPLDLKLKLDVLVCAEVCVPKSFTFALTLPAGAATPDGGDTQLLAKARASVPTADGSSGITIGSVEEVSDKGAAALQVEAAARDGFVTSFGQGPDVIAEVEPPVDFGTPRVVLSANARHATFLVPLKRPLPVGAHLTGRQITVTVTDGDRATEAPGRTIVQGASAVQEAPGPSLFAMLGIALVGGLILNLMPCVLPVLSLKLLSVVGQGGRAPGAVRAGFLATAAGIVVSFLVIAAALIGLKAAGRSIGWGIQFQEPGFIAAMAVLVTVFASHLFGLFEVPLPRFVADAASTRTGPDESLAGHFVTGAFATVLATPCSAPFLGTAVGFALAAAPVRMVAIFAALGIGLALPYLLVAAVPQFAAGLPRPGRWMVVLKQLMAIPLSLTALWLLSILATQVSLVSAGLVFALLVAVVALFVLRQRLSEPRRRFASLAVVVVAVAAVALPDAVASGAWHRANRPTDVIAWRSFDRDRIRSLVSQGKTVFVDVTADWCLTCQANKRFVLSRGTLADRLNKDAVPMQADWTRPDAAIAAYLASYGRYGIPFNIVYGPAAPAGIVLPELLSPGEVSAALDKASGTKASLLQPSGSRPAARDRSLHADSTPDASGPAGSRT